MPLLRSAVPMNTGTIFCATQARRTAAISVGASMASPARYCSASASSTSATASTSFSRAASASARKSSSISPSSGASSSPPVNTICFIATKSMTPRN